MYLTSELVQAFKVQLQQSILVCSERGLFYASKWAAEILDGIQTDLLDAKVPFTQNETHIPTLSAYHTEYESSLAPLSEYDYNRYQYAKTLFYMRHFNAVIDVLGQSNHPKLYFLRLYSKYLMGERRKEEFMQDVLGSTESCENPELDSIYQELHENYHNLDAFGLYLLGIVLKRRRETFKAAAVLLESVRKYQYNWSAWMELASLVQNKKMFLDLRTLLNREFESSLVKEFFLAKVCIDLQGQGTIFRDIMDSLDDYFPKSAYILSQWATFYYDAMEYNESLVLFEELRKTHPSRLDDMDVFSNLLYLQNLKDKLCVLALECEKVDKYRPETCCVRGNYCGLKHETVESIEYFKRAIRLNKSYHLAWTLLGHSYIESQDSSTAIECYRRAVEVNNRDYRSWYGLGQAYEVMKYTSDAIYYYQKATDLRPQDGRMWKALASCYSTLKQDKEAENYNRRAEACDRRSNKSEMIQIARIFERRGKMGVAIDFYQEVWQRAVASNSIDEQIADICLLLARYALSIGRLSDAEQYAIPALNMNHPYHEDARTIIDEVRVPNRSTGSTTYSVTSATSRHTASSMQQETSAKIYFVELQNYLSFILAKEASEGVPTARTAARQKLSRLNNLQFHELATDVYDELMRRNNDSHRSFLPVREDFHPRRNQARQKLATLPSSRFRDLSSDVYHELRRRYPHILLAEQLPPLPQSSSPSVEAQPSQSTNIIPVKGMMSVESVNYYEDNNNSSNNNQPMTDNLDSLMADLGNMVKPSRSEMSQHNSSNSEIDNVRYEYELKIASMTKKIKMLEEGGNNNEYNRQLEDKYNKLLNEHKEQQMAVQEVKNEIRILIDELKSLSEKNESLRSQKEQADITIQSLTEEAKSWKTKYESINMELRNYKVKSMQFDPSKELFLKPTPKGAIGHPYIIEYQTAIDELMQVSRSTKPSDVLVTMRSIVMACKSITTEVEEYEVKTGLSEMDQSSLYEIKKKFSTSLSSLLSAATSFANGMGITPVSLVDAAAITLTTTIVDLVKLLGMRSVTSDLNNNNSNNSHNNSNDTLSPQQLSQFLKKETDHIVASVQNLLSALRTNDKDLFNIITSIINIVSNIVTVSKQTFATDKGNRYGSQGTIILNDLAHCNNKIIKLRDDSFSNVEFANATAKRNLAQESYEIAKYTKELINMLDM
ncbi:hypothetical protein G6F57_005882 [Rhizopus arrhizus]|nr:hypothetical protein G6F23_001346 [Rhizopus arrhizus]KAG1419354.1 hypothetical protein G6F58_004647 [Rhizopus delemar]KAG0800220.1 hypothetical protein G6F22_002449 [Rhizopus arrhizus]KAG0812073.1 hypothetical protein G6F20_006656 [Rhizopus arrhizus]KAG0833350.1 hypothetical protein G6F18_006809 [Rhizopus arrhizus]